ncbi:MAG: hypothetical protein U0X91_31850 [Spirosomataceae bacterium]
MKTTKSALGDKEWEKIHQTLKIATAPKLEQANELLKKTPLPVRKK